MTYKEQLETKEWKAKRLEILERDNFHCQKCGKYGACGEDVFIPISSLSDIKKYIPDEKLFKTINNALFNIYIIEYNDINCCSFSPYSILGNHRISINEQWELVSIISHNWHKNHPNWTNFIEFDYDTIGYTNQPYDWILINKDNYIKYPIRAKKIAINKGASICSFYGMPNKDKTSKGFIKLTHKFISASLINNPTFDDILEDNIYLYINRVKLNIEYPILNIHHKSYIENHLAWEYDNNNLITLCEDCHKQIHKSNSIPLFNQKAELVRNMQTCDRCGGCGYLPQYKYVNNGICFKCGGRGVI